MFNWLDKPITWRTNFKAAGVSLLLTGLFYGWIWFEGNRQLKKTYEFTEKEEKEEE